MQVAVAFASDAGNLLTGDTNGVRDIFLSVGRPGSSDDPPVVARMSTRVDGTEGNGPSDFPSIAISAAVAFQSAATNLVVNDTNGKLDVFVSSVDLPEFLPSGTTLPPSAIARVSVDSTGAQSNGDSSRPAISADGRFVAFQSNATNLAPGVADGRSHVFVHDRDADGNGILDEAEPGSTSTEVVSVSSTGEVGDGDDSLPSISADGRFVAFRSTSTNLAGPGGDTNGLPDVYRHDRVTGVTDRVSVSSAGGESNGASALVPPAISADGRSVAFQSDASNLISGDSNGTSDVFARGPFGGVDLTGTERFHANVLGVLDTGTGVVTTLCPASLVAVAGNVLAYLQGSSSFFCPALFDISPAVGPQVQLSVAGGTPQNLGLQALQVATSPTWLAAIAPETPFLLEGGPNAVVPVDNGDADKTDRLVLGV